jgi:hypothetical protein
MSFSDDHSYAASLSRYSSVAESVSGTIHIPAFAALPTDRDLANTQPDLAFFSAHANSQFDAVLAGHKGV